MARRGGFTLIEITVVLAIAAVVTAITVGGFKELGASNKRITCQTNLVQIYQACRLYAADEGGSFPYYDPEHARNTTTENIGLWSLYTFSKTPELVNDLPSVGAKPVDRYLRSVKTLHCPADADNASLYSDDSKLEYNQKYLSYQTTDTIKVLPGNTTVDVPTYQPIVMAKPATSDAEATNKWKRQLLPYDTLNPSTNSTPNRRLPAEDTIVTWCKWHYVQGGRAYDNVLFYDGSVQLLPREQDVNGVTLTGRDRVPKTEEPTGP